MVNSPQFSRVLEQMNIIESKLNNGMKGKAGLRNLTPSIQVTCFDDDTYNENMRKRLENPAWSESNEDSTAEWEAENSAYKENVNNEGESVHSGYTSSDEVMYNRNATLSREENGAVKSNNQTGKRSQHSSKESKGETTTKVENNHVQTKDGNLNEESAAEQLKTSLPRTPRRPSLNSSTCDLQRSDVIASPSLRRRRYTVCAVSGENDIFNDPQNNSLHNIQKASARGSCIQLNSCSATSDRKDSSEFMVNKKKLERIDLSFKIDPTINSPQSNKAKKGSQTCEEPTQIKKNSGDMSPDEVFRIFDDDYRSDYDGSSAIVGCPPKTIREAFQPKEPMKSRKFSENSLSILNTDNRNASRSPSPARRISTSTIEGVNSTFLVTKENSRSRSETDTEIKQRLNLATPPQARKLSSPQPLPGEKPARLGVRIGLSLNKCETDLRRIVPEEKNAEVGRQGSASTPPLMRRISSSLGVSGSPSLSKSETDLRKLVSEEETEKIRNTLPSQSPRMTRRASTSRQQSPSTVDGTSSPLTPQQERKIYLAAAKSATRLPARAKSRNDLQASSQKIIDQAEKELVKFGERLPHISMEQVMKTWQTDRRHWNMVSTVVNPYEEGNAIGCKANMKGVKDCRYIRESVVMTKKKKHSH